MALDFPTPTTVGEIFTQGSLTYIWDGTKWVGQAPGAVVQSKIEKANTSAEVVDNGSDGQFKVTTEGTQRFTVDSSGRVGIGTTSPADLLEIKGSFPKFSIVDSDTTNDKFSILHNGGGTIFQVDGNNVGPNSSFLITQIDGSERMRIDSSGRMLVGTSSTISGSDTNALVQASHSSGAKLCLGTSDSTVVSGQRISDILFKTNAGGSYASAAIIQCAADADQGTNDYPSRLVFSTTADGASSPTERLRIDSSGNVGIGVTSPVGKTEVSSNDGFTISNATRTGTSGAQWRFIPHNGSGSATNLRIYEGVSATEVINITKTGNVGIGTSSPLAKLDVNGSATFAGTISDSIGPLRRIGVNAQSGAYTFVVGDAGKIIRSAGSGAALTLNQNIFTAGDMISVFNVSGGNNTVVQGTGVTLHNTADAATGTRTIAAKGMATLVCTASNEFAISGSQLT